MRMFRRRFPSDLSGDSIWDVCSARGKLSFDCVSDKVCKVVIAGNADVKITNDIKGLSLRRQAVKILD